MLKTHIVIMKHQTFSVFTCITLLCGGCPASCPGWHIQTPGGEQSPAPPWWKRTSDSHLQSKHRWSIFPVGTGRIMTVALTNWETLNLHDVPFVLDVSTYLLVRALLQCGLHHNVAFHAHLERRDLGRHTAVTWGPQCSQELASSDSMHYHRPILTRWIER